jgi:hypothetical protein
MRDDLVAEEIEVDPLIRRTSFTASEKRTVEGARFGKIADRECEMEAGLLRHRMSLASCTAERSKVQA